MKIVYLFGKNKNYKFSHLLGDMDKNHNYNQYF